MDAAFKVSPNEPLGLTEAIHRAAASTESSMADSTERKIRG